MSFANPTALRVGATGLLNGRRYTVAGRVVLGMDDAGDTYYWNEFNLVDDAGENATLVFEKTENGPEWKIFTLIEPSQPMTAREAAARRVGENVSLDGNPIRITLVDQSRVYYIEGTAPEGVEVGDVADYFNAESAQRMLVASWTGDEIEFYRGVNISAERVAAAFNLPKPAIPTGALSRFSAANTGAGANYSGLIMKLIGVVLLAVVGYFIHSSWAAKRRNAPPVTQAAPASLLTNGMHGTLAVREYTITGHALVQVSKVGARFNQHEYDLVSYAGDHALLVCGLNGGKQEWHLLLTPQTPPPLSPPQAAARRLGDIVTVDSHLLRVTEMFESQILAADSLGTASGMPGTARFGFVARSPNEWLLARWTGLGIQFHCGRALPEKEVFAAFGAKPEAAR